MLKVGSIRFGVFVLIVVLLCALTSPAQVPPAGKIKAFVSIMPQAYFVERVGGSAVEVEILVAPGQSPATFEPTPKQMAALAEANIFFRIGLPFEDQLIKGITAINDRLPVIDTRQGIELRPMDEEPHEGHEHEHHHQGRYDPHIWLDPGLVKIQARNIADGLIKLDPVGKTVYEKNLLDFQTDLTRIDSTIARILAPLKGR